MPKNTFDYLLKSEPASAASPVECSRCFGSHFAPRAPILLRVDGFKLHNRGGGGFLCAVSRFKVFAKFWLPVLIWAALIYSVSADGKSVNHSSHIIEPLVRWLFPMSNDTLWATILFVRKCAHVTEFAIPDLSALARFAGDGLAAGRGWSQSLP